MKNKTITFVMLIGIVIFTEMAAFSSDHSLEEILMQNWIKYCKELNNYSATIQLENEWMPELKKKKQIQEYHIVGCLPFVIKEQILEGTTTVWGVNPQYAFRLISTKQNDWTVDHVIQYRHIPTKDIYDHINNENQTGKQYNPETILYRNLAMGLDLHSTFLITLLRDKDFVIEKSESLKEKDLNILRITFKYSPTIMDKTIFPRSGTIDLLPDYYYVIYRANIEASQSGLDDQWNFCIDNKYDLSTSLPLITFSKRCCYGKEPNKPLRYSMNSTFHLFKTDTDKNPPARFTLSHYGLPEPDFEIRRSQFMVFRYLLMVTGLALVLFACYRLYLRKKASSTDTTGD